MTFSKLTILVLPTILFIGCSNTPNDAVTNMYDALKEGNVVKLANNTDESMSVMLIADSLKECSIDKKSYTDEMKLAIDCIIEKYADIKYKNVETVNIINEHAYVKVSVISNNNENSLTLIVKKIGDKWMVKAPK